jgi:minor curlin subunit
VDSDECVPPAEAPATFARFHQILRFFAKSEREFCTKGAIGVRLKFTLITVSILALYPSLGSAAEAFSQISVPQVSGYTQASISVKDTLETASKLSVSAPRFEAGPGNRSYVSQNGDYNSVAITQSGSGNRAFVAQTGFHNGAIIQQSGGAYQAFVIQQGAGNSAVITQR